jgi:hypothetical protein
MLRANLLTKRAAGLTAATLFTFWAWPAAATTCDMEAIGARSTVESAVFLLDHSDYVGFGFVRDISRWPAVKQQEVNFVVRLKGANETVAMAPESVNRVSEFNSFYSKWLYGRADELRLYALVAIKDGAALPACNGAIIQAKPTTDLYRALVAEAARRRTLQEQPTPAADKPTDLKAR